jgi:hypothetical protein
MSTRLPIHPNTEGRDAFSTDFDLEKLLSSNEHVVTKSSGGGKKSSTMRNLPNGSSVYFILDFIYFPPFSPVSCTDNADNTASICETNRYNSISDFAKTVIPLFTSHQSSRKENREKFYLNPECRIYERFKDC